jgi:hypothetical protein
VQSGQVRFVLLGGGPGGPPPGGAVRDGPAFQEGNRGFGGPGGPGGQGSVGAISQWVQANGTPVSTQSQLYDLGSLQRVA